MLQVSKMIASAEAALGWPYVSPGTNDRNGIDCSGLFVKIYRDQGESIYHGSNRIYRQYCGDKGKLSSASQLLPGMAVFKWNPNTPASYSDGLGDFQHIGLVCSANPLRIIHASSAAGCVTEDTKLGKWAYWGKLKDVDYGEQPAPVPSPEPGPDPEPQPVPELKIVWAENGKPVNLRAKPIKSADLVERVPCGEAVDCIGHDGEWTQVRWKQWRGWMMSMFLVDEAPAPAPDPEPSTDKPILRRGDFGPWVSLLQAQLIQRGYNLNQYGTDGKFGQETECAVIQFQRDWDLPEDGIVGPSTWALLESTPAREKTYSVTIKGLDLTQARALVNNYPGAIMAEENGGVSNGVG